MKALLIKLLKIFLLITLILLIGLVVFGLVLTLGWPWWMGGFILAGTHRVYIDPLVYSKAFFATKGETFCQPGHCPR